MNWTNDPFTLDGYSVHHSNEGEDEKQRIQSHGQWVIERHAPIDLLTLKDPATMDGAVESGERTARMIQHLFKEL